jgi:pyruvate/2-oxoglutarate dehydrogenase complex dihydrolipoamide acyltransferase (E2) component
MSAGARTGVAILLSGAAGEYMESATVVEWRASEGTWVAAGETVAVVETAKAATEIPAPVSGRLARIAAPVGREVAVGTALGTILPDQEAAAPAERAPIAPASVSPLATREGIPRRWQASFASPLAKRVACEAGIDLSRLAGSGPGGRISASDVREAIAGERDREAGPRAGSEIASGETERAPPAAADRGAATFSMAIVCDARAMLEERALLWEAGESVPFLALVLRALAATLARFPALGGGPIRLSVLSEKGSASVGIALTEGMSLSELARALSAPRAGDIFREAAACLHVLDASALGITEIVPSLAAGVMAAIGVGALCEAPVFAGGRSESYPGFRLSLSADPSAIDTGTAARFLAALRAVIEKETALPGGDPP